MRVKSSISIFLLLISIVLISMPVIPHHHHGNGIICIKDDLKEDDCCGASHTHHHEENDPCCDKDCASDLLSNAIPAMKTTGLLPPLVCLEILFSESRFPLLIQSLNKNIHDDPVYVESLHGTYITRVAGLRAPPYFG